MPSGSFHTVDPGSALSLALLEKAYHELYVPAFPDPDERDGFDLWLDCFRRGLELVAVIAGDNLDSPDSCVLKALSVAYYLPEANAGWLCYNVSNPAFRRQGLGKKMVDMRIGVLKDLARKHGHGSLGGVYFEIDDPAKVSADKTSVDPKKRLSYYTKMGARAVPIDYIQPETRPGGGRCRHLLLMAIPLEGAFPGPEETRRFITALYHDATLHRDGVEGSDPALDPDVQAMGRQIDAWKAAEGAAKAA